jgi:hypothetical protein
VSNFLNHSSHGLKINLFAITFFFLFSHFVQQQSSSSYHHQQQHHGPLG